MAKTIDQLMDRYGLPGGYARVAWGQVAEGQTVYVYGTHDDQGCAYGPHTVDSVTERRLRNPQGRTFLEYQESLLTRIA